MAKHVSISSAAMLLALSLAAPCVQAQTPGAPTRDQLETSQETGDDAAPQEDAEPVAPLAPVAAPEEAPSTESLKRRVRLGLAFVEGAAGLTVREVVPDTPAATAGIVAGDVVTRVDGQQVAGAAALGAQIRTMRPGSPVTFTVVRDGEPVDVQVVPDETSPQAAPGVKVQYRSFTGTRGRLRSVWSVPAAPSDEPLPVALIVRGVGAGPSDAPGAEAIARLATRLTRRGVIAVRFDPAGVGDSDGPANATVDFNTEVADVHAALAHIRDDKRVDGARVYLVGQGTGGGIAAVAASTDQQVAGLVVLGTIARPLMEYLLESRRSQLVLAGVAPADADSIIREHVSIFARVLTAGAQPAEDALGIVGPGGTLLGKDPEFWRQLDRVNFGKIYSELKIPVLNAIGEFDFVSSAGDHRVIAEALKAGGQAGPHMVVLDRADHDLHSFASRDAAFAGFGSGDAPVNELAVGTIVDWVATKSRERAASEASDEPSVRLSSDGELSDN
jgi:alpha-beta hydrolase superfamily lysophospholipase